MTKIQRPPLTPEQQKLVEQNHGLIIAYAVQLQLPVDEVYGALAMGLCKAATIFKPELGYKFSTIAYKCMRSELALEHRAYYRHNIPQDQMWSIDSMRSDDGRCSDVSYLDYIDDPALISRFDYSSVELRDFYQMLNPIERDIATRLQATQSAKDVAQQIDRSQQYVSWVRHKLKKKWHQYLALTA